MPKFTPLQVISGALALAAMFAASLAQSEDIKTEVDRAVEEALNGRDAKLVAPVARPKS